tara:strand:- start:285 stop:1022 length:738 start_codon:yes stop_codon:yes gene_type:complete
MIHSDFNQGGSNKPNKNHVDFKSAFYFQTPLWIAEAPMFLKNTIKVTDKYIKKADKLLKDKLKNEPKWRKDMGTFGLSKHSESFSADPKVRDLVQFIGQRSYEFLDWSGFNLQNHSLHFTEFWVQEFSEKGGGHHSTHAHWNQHVSGFYFLKCSEKTSFPIFHDPRPGAIMTKLPLKDEKQISMGSSMVNYRPKPGTMIIFPGYVPHEYSVDPGLEPFRFIHWNIKVVESTISKESSMKKNDTKK